MYLIVLTLNLGVQMQKKKPVYFIAQIFLVILKLSNSFTNKQKLFCLIICTLVD